MVPEPTIPSAAMRVEQDYVSRLDAACAEVGLQPWARADLRSAVGERMALARADAGHRDDPVSVALDVVNDLGPPGELVRKAVATWPRALRPRRATLTRPELAALAGMSLGWLTAGIGLVIAAIALPRCRRWTVAERTAAFVVALTFPLLAVRLVWPGPGMPLPLTAGTMVFAVVIGVPWFLRFRLAQRHGRPV